jgi:hypothetical protein
VRGRGLLVGLVGLALMAGGYGVVLPDGTCGWPPGEKRTDIAVCEIRKGNLCAYTDGWRACPKLGPVLVVPWDERCQHVKPGAMGCPTEGRPTP